MAELNWWEVQTGIHKLARIYVSFLNVTPHAQQCKHKAATTLFFTLDLI